MKHFKIYKEKTDSNFQEYKEGISIKDILDSDLNQMKSFYFIKNFENSSHQDVEEEKEE